MKYKIMLIFVLLFILLGCEPMPDYTETVDVVEYYITYREVYDRGTFKEATLHEVVDKYMICAGAECFDVDKYIYDIISHHGTYCFVYTYHDGWGEYYVGSVTLGEC